MLTNKTCDRSQASLISPVGCVLWFAKKGGVELPTAGMLWSFLTSLNLPNEDFGRPNKPVRVRLGSIKLANMMTKDHRMRSMRCVEFSGMQWCFVTSLCSPNEDFGRPNQPLDMHPYATMGSGRPYSGELGYHDFKLSDKWTKGSRMMAKRRARVAYGRE